MTDTKGRNVNTRLRIIWSAIRGRPLIANCHFTTETRLFFHPSGAGAFVARNRFTG